MEKKNQGTQKWFRSYRINSSCPLDYQIFLGLLEDFSYIPVRQHTKEEILTTCSPKRRWHKSIHVKSMSNKILLSVLACSQDWRSKLLWWGFILQQHPETLPFTWTKALSLPQLCFVHVLPPQEGQRLGSFIPWNFQLQPIRTQTDLFYFFFSQNA